MSLCFNSCYPTAPAGITQNCEARPRLGGIAYIVFGACDINRDVTELSTLDWCNWYNTGKITLSNKLIGNKPEASYEKRRINSCSSETVIGITHKIEFEDLTFIGKGQDNFWGDIVNNPSAYPFGYITCDGYFTGFFDPTAIEISDIIPDSNTEYITYKGAIEFNSLMLPEPVYIGELPKALIENCAGVPNFDPCNLTGEVNFLSNIKGGCKVGDVTMVAPFYRGVTYDWYLNAVLKQSGTSHTYQPDQFGLPVNVVLNKDGCTPQNIVAPIPQDFNGGNVPSVLGITSVPDGVGYFKITAVPTASVPNMSYRLINSQGYQTGWQTSNIFRGVIPGATTIQIRVAGFECITSYNFSI